MRSTAACAQSADGKTRISGGTDQAPRRKRVSCGIRRLQAGDLVPNNADALRFIASKSTSAGWIPGTRTVLWSNLFGEGSPIGYHNPEIVRLLRENADIGFDPESADRIYRELWEIFREDLPITFVHTHIGHFVAHRRLRGLSSPWGASPLLFMEDLWLEDEP